MRAAAFSQKSEALPHQDGPSSMDIAKKRFSELEPETRRPALSHPPSRPASQPATQPASQPASQPMIMGMNVDLRHMDVPHAHIHEPAGRFATAAGWTRVACVA
jgi:hypothetical protein